MQGSGLLQVVSGLSNIGTGTRNRLSWAFSHTSRETTLSMMERSPLSPAHLQICRKNYERRQAQLLNGPAPEPPLPAHHAQYIEYLDPARDGEYYDDHEKYDQPVGHIEDCPRQEVRQGVDAQEYQELEYIEDVLHQEVQRAVEYGQGYHNPGYIEAWAKEHGLVVPDTDYQRPLSAAPYSDSIGARTHDTESSDILNAIRTHPDGRYTIKMRFDSLERLDLDRDYGKEFAKALVNKTLRKYNYNNGTTFTGADVSFNHPELPANRAEDIERARLALENPCSDYISDNSTFCLSMLAISPSPKTPEPAGPSSGLSPAILAGLGAYIDPKGRNIGRKGSVCAKLKKKSRKDNVSK